MRSLVLSSLLASLVASACSSDSGAQFVAHFDRPVDLAFGCIDATRARPLSDCSGTADADAGAAPVSIGMAIQETTGDVVVVRFDGKSDPVDSDPLTPGFNGLAVGSRPVSADTTADGCFVVVANAGSCDLAAVDVRKAAAPLLTTAGVGGDFERDSVTRQPILNSAGQVLAAAPERVAVGPAGGNGVDCPESPVGIAYLSYPRCHKVVAVDLASKTIQASIDFSSGAPEIKAGDVTCPVDCAEVDNPATGTASDGLSPGAIVLEPEGGRLYIGARDLSELVVADLDASGLFAGVTRVPLEDAGGLVRLAASGDVRMGSLDQLGTHRFVYAIATDASVRVIEVSPTRTPTECDTQIDPRFARNTTSLALLPCFPVGGASNPPRRVSARGPGIRLPGDSTPYDLDFFNRTTKPKNAVDPSPSEMNGTFVAVTGRNSGQAGVAFLVTVDDDNYEDSEANDPLNVDTGRSMPHQLRDGLENRRSPTPEDCRVDEVLSQPSQGPTRVDGVSFSPLFGVYNNTLRLPEGTFVPGTEIPVPEPEDPDPTDTDHEPAPRLMPLLHLATCQPPAVNPDTPDVLPDPVRVLALSGLNPDRQYRERSFPDLQRVRNEDWRVRWEGQLFYADSDQLRPGGQFAPVPGQLAMTLTDGSAPFCEMGVEEGDTVRITGCTQSFHCGVNETCYFHPESPPELDGVCLPTDQVDELANACRPLLISNREYLIKRGVPMLPDQLTLVPRPTVLDSSPPDGCTGDQQCRDLFADEVERDTREPAEPDHPLSWICRSDEHLTGPRRCTAVCPANTDAECPFGSVCQDKVCVEGGFVDAQCFGSLQKYEVRATDAFTVVGAQTGYLHNRLLDLESGQCITDPTPDPLRVGRFHPIEPACEEGDPFYPAGPNPCSLVLDEPVLYDVSSSNSDIGLRKSRGIRFRNFGLRLDIADVVVPQSAANLLGALQAAYPRNFGFAFAVTAGFAALVEPLSVTNAYPFTVFPGRVRVAPNQQIWVVDMGDADPQIHGALVGVSATGTTVIR